MRGDQVNLANTIYTVNDTITIAGHVYAIIMNTTENYRYVERIVNEQGQRMYRLPIQDFTINKKTKEELIAFNSCALLNAFVERLNTVHYDAVYTGEMIQKFQQYINTNEQMNDYLSFSYTNEQAGFNQNQEKMIDYFFATFSYPVLEETVEEKVEQQLAAQHIVEASLSTGATVALNTESGDVLSFQKGDSFTNAMSDHARLTGQDPTMVDANDAFRIAKKYTNSSSEFVKPKKADASLATTTAHMINEQIPYVEDQVQVLQNPDDFENSNILFDPTTNQIQEIIHTNDGIEIQTANHTTVGSDNEILPFKQETTTVEQPQTAEERYQAFFTNMENLYQSDYIAWNMECEQLAMTNSSLLNQYMTDHDTYQQELSTGISQEKPHVYTKTNSDVISSNKEDDDTGMFGNAAFIDIMILSCISSIVGTISLLIILLNIR